MGYLGGRGKVIQKNLKLKISRQTAFNFVFT
jgi:hypothetical protein